MKQSSILRNAFLPALLLAACASTDPELPPAPSATAQPSQPQMLPQALMRSAYDAPDWGDAPPEDILPVQLREAAGEMPASTASNSRQQSGYDVPEIVDMDELDMPAKPAGAPQRLTFVDEPAPRQREAATVPPAPKATRATYETAIDLDALDPILVTDSRAERAAPKADPAPYQAQAYAQNETETPRKLRGTNEAPRTSAPVPSANEPQPAVTSAATPTRPDSFAGNTQSVMPEAAKREASVPSGQTGGYALHLASYRDPQNVVKGWEILKQRHGDVLGSYQAVGASVDIPGKGEFIRLLVGPFDSPAAAKSLCGRLESRDEYCKVMPFKGSPVS